MTPNDKPQKSNDEYEAPELYIVVGREKFPRPGLETAFVDHSQIDENTDEKSVRSGSSSGSAFSGSTTTATTTCTCYSVSSNPCGAYGISSGAGTASRITSGTTTRVPSGAIASNDADFDLDIDVDCMCNMVTKQICTCNLMRTKVVTKSSTCVCLQYGGCSCAPVH